MGKITYGVIAEESKHHKVHVDDLKKWLPDLDWTQGFCLERLLGRDMW